jgi:hypothetical protein
MRSGLFRCFRFRDNGHIGSAVGFLAEVNIARLYGKNGVILANADAGARMPLGSALTNDDVAGITASPPNFFTPRRLEFESRPLRVEPPAFLCAMGLLLFRPQGRLSVCGLLAARARTGG